MGQLHDDISEVNQGKIIRDIFLAPKLYALEIIVYYKERPDEVVIEYHIRAKGVPKDSQKDLTFEKFQDMLDNQTPMTVSGRRFAKAFKKTDETAIKTYMETRKSTENNGKDESWTERVIDGFLCVK